jgi:hypothetical protein
MQQEDPDFREWALNGIETSRLEFAARGQGWAALQADRLARSIGEPTPTWAAEAVERNRKWSRESVERSGERFSETNNPMYACQAYLAARGIGDPLPEWVLNYIDHSMSVFWRTFQGFNESPVNRSRENRPAEAFAVAFGIKASNGGRRHARTGRGTVWTRFGDTDWIQLGSLVHSVIKEWARAGKPIKETAAAREATERHNLRSRDPVKKASFSVIWRAWARYKREYRPQISDLAPRRP